jgi:hypothetical protein
VVGVSRLTRQRLRAERQAPGIKPPGASELGVVPRRFGENPPRPDGTRYRPTAATQSVAKPDPYWAVGYGGEPVLIYPD